MSNVQGWNNPQFPKRELDQMKIAELQQTAKRLKIENFAQLRKVELLRAIRKRLSHGHGVCDDTQVREALTVKQVGPFWLIVSWTVSSKSLQRAAASMKSEWHRARLILRLNCVSNGETGPAVRHHVHDLALPDGIGQWCVEFDSRSRYWNVELGYSGESGRFFSLLHSPDIEVELSDSLQKSPGLEFTEQDVRDELHLHDQNLDLELTGILKLAGKTNSNCRATIDRSDVEVDPATGRFSWNHPLKNGRLCVPVIVERFGQRQRAVVTVESNIHYLEFEKSRSGS